MKNPLRARLG